MSSIRPLPNVVVARIKSSAIITSLNGVVIELLKNSLDASSSKIDIDVDYGRGSCTVEDNGLGISPAEFHIDGGLGKLYRSSKYINSSATHGKHGSFLASLAALSLLSITSLHHLHHSQNSITLNRSEVIARQIPAPPQKHVLGPSHGTCIIVRDLFGNMPVRVKQRVALSMQQAGGGRQWDALCKEVTSFLLAWPYPLNVSIRDVASGQKIRLRGTTNSLSPRRPRAQSELSVHVGNMLSQAALVQPEQKSSWVSASASTSKLSIQGVLSLQPAPTKNVQFISLGIWPLTASNGHNVLYEDINRAFSNSTFGATSGMVEMDYEETQRRSKDRRYKSDGFTNHELKGPIKGIYRWPIFYIKIEFVNECISYNRSDALLEDSPGARGSISELLQVMLAEFLGDNHFIPTDSRLPRLKNQEELLAGSKLTKEVGRARMDENQFSSSTGVTRSLSTLSSRSKSKNIMRSESPFSSWSRIKSGRRIVSSNITGKLEEVDRPPLNADNAEEPGKQISTNFGHHIEPKTAECLEIIDTRAKGSIGKYVNHANASPNASIIAKSGEVTREPFHDLLSPRHSTPSTQEIISIPVRTTIRDTDSAVISWTDPISRESYLIDTLTGLASHESSNSQNIHSVLSSIEIPQRTRVQNAIEPNQEPSVWMKKVLNEWENPVFKPTEAVIPQISAAAGGFKFQEILHGHRHNCSQLDIDRAFKESSAGFIGRLTRSSLKHAKVVSQIDKKFILIKVTPLPQNDSSDSFEGMLVIVDQHAADERYRIEELLATFWATSDVATFEMRTKSGVVFTSLEKPIVFDISECEVHLLAKHSQYLADWGLIYTLPQQNREKDRPTKQPITITGLPSGIVERCRQQPKLSIELIRSEAWKREERGQKQISTHSFESELVAARKQKSENYPWLERIHEFPQGLLDMLNSRACRSAVMFNDELSIAQCKDLVSRLADCAFPFQCAHGRPSMVPLVDMDAAFKATLENDTFGASFKCWKRQLVDDSIR